MTTKAFKRRDFLKAGAAAWLFTQTASAQAFTSALGRSKDLSHKKLVWVFLRGALDGLHTLIPHTDPDLGEDRKALIAPIKSRLLALNPDFSLHPDLVFMHKLYQQQQMAPVLAVASGYRDRSHFDAQDQMESGLNITDHDSGWLARAAKEVAGNGIAISRSVPIALRGKQFQAETWYPSTFPEADEDLLARLSGLYQNDAALEKHLAALVAQKQNPAMQMQEQQRTNFGYLAERCGELLANSKSTNCAMLELGGWDTHNNQHGRLSRMFKQLDQGLQRMQAALGPTWDNTLVVVSTEFGRTVAINGTNGTDHGTASSMFVLGGALSSFPKHSPVKGGKVLGVWPGLAPSNLYEERDLMPTSDVRMWIADALMAQWQLSAAGVKRVFPDYA